MNDVARGWPLISLEWEALAPVDLDTYLQSFQSTALRIAVTPLFSPFQSFVLPNSAVGKPNNPPHPPATHRAR